MKKNTSEKNHRNFLNEAETLLEQNKFPDALTLAQERLRLMPADADAYVIAASALIGMGRSDEARDVLKDVGMIISEFSFFYDRVGDAYRKSGFHQDAAFCYEKFLSLHPGAEDARMVIEKMTLLDQEDHPVNEIDVIDENIPESELFTVTLADLYIRQGHFPEARKILEEIINKEPQNVQAAKKLDMLRKALDPASTVGEKFDSDKLIKVLSSWLQNIDRLKMHATGE
jgi:tetratricopeptide (TPR) repeat protein